MCLLSIQTSFDGCASKPRLSGVHFPITSGFHTRLPTDQQHILLWGDPRLTAIAEEWLRSHRYSELLIPPQNLKTGSDRQAALASAAKLNAEFALLLERVDTKEGTLLESHCETLFHTSVDIHGLSVEREEIVLRGRAHYPQCVERNDKIVRNLICQALATAWGFRPSRQLEIPSHLACTTGQTAPTLNR